MGKTLPLIRVKLHPPVTRQELVSRPRLQEQIAQGLRGPLTLVTAPAGFGKTTLVASCITKCRMPFAWFSLDKDDNQTERFLKYLVAALQEADHSIGGEATQLIEDTSQLLPEAVITSLINNLDTYSGEIALVLDDYQFISSQTVHEEVAFLLEHCPKSLHLVISTRSDPPLPLSRLRARGQMVEIRGGDLRFNKSEADKFLTEVMGLHLDTFSMAVLEERTEGWIVGLQMAALSLRDREDVSGFIEGFSGTNRYILDYLLEEVLAVQSPEIQHFLLYTSILERLTAPLCDAIMTYYEGINNRAASTLEYLEAANLFLVPLDNERIWYRYHHLFTDLLFTRLQQTLEIQDITALHTRAAEWYQRNGFILEAIHHASLTPNHEWVEQLIEENYMEMFHRGEASSMRFWTGKLSKEIIFRSPWLCIYEAQSHAMFGQLDEAELLIAKAEKHLEIENSDFDTKSMLGHLSYVKSRVTGMRGDVQRAIELSLIALENAPPGNRALQSGIGVMLGVGYFLKGDFTNAKKAFTETIQSSIAANAINGTVAAYCHLARLYAIQGQLHKSYELYQKAGNFAQQAGNRNRGVMSLVNMGFANALYELNDLQNALTHIDDGLELINLWGNADDMVLIYTTLARIQQAIGNQNGGEEAIEKGITLIQTRGVFSFARDSLRTAQVRLWLAQGDLSSADHWAASQEGRMHSDQEFNFENELIRITLSRVYITQKKLDKSIRLLTRLEESAESAGRRGRLIEILILKSLTLHLLGDTAQALVLLGQCLSQAEPEGYVRIFLDEGHHMRSLLSQWIDQSGKHPMRNYANHLLSQYKIESGRVRTGQEKISLPGNLVGSLSQRELEVLKLIALGKTNQEIAAQLIISPGTVKAHTASIYQKLDVANRTEAVAHARMLGILS